MFTLNQNSILDQFKLLSGLTDEETPRYLGLVLSAKSYVERLLLREAKTEEESLLLTNACAAKVFFDYTVLCAATSRTLSTQSGSVFTKVSDDENVSQAQTLMYNAFAAVPRDFMCDNGFVFERTVG